MKSQNKIWAYPSLNLLNDTPSSLRSILASDAMANTSKLGVALGFNALGEPICGDITVMSNILITGKEGTGKTTLLKTFLTSLLFKSSPTEVKLIIADPSKVNLTTFNGIPHLLSPVIVEPEKIISALHWLLAEIDRRYKIFIEAGVKGIESYNEAPGFQALPYIVIFIDDYSEFRSSSPTEFADSLGRIFEIGKKAGVYTVISGTKPEKEIAGSVQSRIAFLSDGGKDTQPAIARSASFLAPHDFLLIKNNETFPLCLQSLSLTEREVSDLIRYLRGDKDSPGNPDTGILSPEIIFETKLWYLRNCIDRGINPFK